ncbi:DUF5615 family PIN-like protein [Sorangium sp. So ce131]|uniref:DUF5615 family PIN-like protein n=1 Tax=Sorangium sp. So ce131 TaxID=3133282 RepID=UPI003F5FDD18
MIRLLVDMNLAPRWVGELGSLGIGAVHWSSVGAADATDREIFSWASANGCVVLTCDLDFTDLLAMTGAASPSVMLLRTRDIRANSLAKRVATVLREHAGALEQGALITVDETKSRIKTLPLRAKAIRRRTDG